MALFLWATVLASSATGFKSTGGDFALFDWSRSGGDEGAEAQDGDEGDLHGEVEIGFGLCRLTTTSSGFWNN